MATAYVAPDFDQRARFNTLRVKPEYRITLRLGEIEDLFENEPGTIKGRMERLQVLGLFYFPLSHKKAAVRYEDTWRWVKSRVFGEKGQPAKTDAEADALLKSALKCRIVGGPVPADWNAPPSELPADAADPSKPAPENFAKIRVPGGFSTQYAQSGGPDFNVDPNCPAEWETNFLFEHESQFYRDHKVLGKLPLVAKVERRPPGGGNWEPAEGVEVHLQLVPAFEPPAWDPSLPASAQFQRPPLHDDNGSRPASGSGLGTKKRYDQEEGIHADASDPQGNNCHSAYGGKRGLGVEDVIFRLAPTPGFNGPNGSRKMAHKEYAAPEKVTPSGDRHKHAVKAKTNADGEAGVIFMPSRMGGDRYRLRSYLPSTGDGASPGSVAATTGTFVVWRNIRISRILRHELAGVDPDLIADAVLHKPSLSSEPAYLRKAYAHDGASVVGLEPLNLGESDGQMAGDPFDPMPRQFARAFCELELDSGAVESLSADEFEEAWRLAAEDCSSNRKTKDFGQGATPAPLLYPDIQHLDFSALFFRDKTFAGPEFTVCDIPMRSPEGYNAAVKPAQRFSLNNPAAFRNEASQVRDLCMAYALHGFQRALTLNGALPGLSLIHGGLGFTWQILASSAPSGIRRNFRGSFLWYAQEFYRRFIYDCTANATHELGHALFMMHAPNEGQSRRSLADHDALPDCACVMSYEPCAGRFCGKSLLSLRGWKISTMA